MQTDVARATFAAGAVRRLAGLYDKLASILCASHARVGGPNGSPARSSESEEVARALDRRGRVHRARRKMPDGEAQAFLKQQRVVHVGTKDANGWPYVVPLVYVYEGGDLLYFHTGGHRGHFESNIRHDARVCAEFPGSEQCAKAKPTLATRHSSIRASSCSERCASSRTAR